MASVLERPAAPPLPSAARPTMRESFRGRGAERALLLWNVPLVALAAAGLAAAQTRPAEAFVPALVALATVWGGCFGLHLLLCLTRFDGDLLLLPLLSLLLMVGAAYHADIHGPAAAGIHAGPYTLAAMVALGVLAAVTAGGRYFRRFSLLLEEKVWWRVAGARPYYESAPFHLMLLGGMAVLLLLLKLKGIRSENGAFVQVPLPGGFSFTPSELVRLAVAFFLADFLGRHSRVLRNLRQPIARAWPLNLLTTERRAELGVVLLTVGLYCLFFYAFHDFGPAVVIIVLTLVVLFAATGRLGTPIALAAGIGVAIGLTVWRDLGFHTLRNRVDMWLDPWHTRFVNGDHQARILWAIASGGWFGMGPGTQNLPRTLPLARNDAAFAGVAATMGMWVALAVLAIFAGIAWRGFLAARQAPTDRMRLLCFSLTALLSFQAVWIAGAMVRVFPFTGINLPFISTGLTSMVASALALGTIWNLSRTRSARADATEATPEVLRGVTRLALPVTAVFALPAVGVVLFGCPWLLGDRTLQQTAFGVGRKQERTAFANPYLEAFRKRFPRGRVFSADGKLMAVSNPDAAELDALRKDFPSFASRVERHERSGPTGERYYPMGEDAAQLVGWTPQGAFMAREGSVETACDSLLRGYNPGQLAFFWRTRNNPLVRPPQPQDLQLSIAAEWQQFAQQRLARAVQSAGGAGGALVVYDASTGQVLAAATAPTFDPNGLTVERMGALVKEDPKDRVLTNKALGRDALYFPGSTFKIVTAAAALESGIQGSATCVNGHNAAPVTWEYGGRRYKRDVGKIADFGRGSHGALGFQNGIDQALAVSCNVFFGSLAAALGPDRLHDTMAAAELSHVPSASQLAEHLPYDGFGQIDVKTSPLEMSMLAAAAGVAREDTPDAVAMRPYWVQAVVTKSGKREPEGSFAPNRKPYRPFPVQVAQRLRRMMIGVVENPSGTAHHAFFDGGATRLPGITVGGKTGTAEFEKTVTVRGKKAKTIGRHAWFVGFARSDHEVQPRTLAFAVLVEDVRRGGTGGTVCAPVARDLIAKILPVAGQQSPDNFQGLDRFYQEIRRRSGPLGPLLDWFKDRLGNRR